MRVPAPSSAQVYLGLRLGEVATTFCELWRANETLNIKCNLLTSPKTFPSATSYTTD